MTPLQKHFARLAAGFVVAIERGVMTREECQILLTSAAFHPSGRFVAGLTPEQRDELATFACTALDDAMCRPGLGAQHDIRSAVALLMGRPRAELLIAAYRAANGRLRAEDVEAVVAEEIAAYLTRLRESGKLRHAG